MRLYVVPEQPESLDTVFNDLWDGAITNFSSFRWRMAMAMLDSSRYSVSLNAMWEVWQSRISSTDQLASRLGWPKEVFQMIERGRNFGSVNYYFPPLRLVCDALSPLLHLVEVVSPGYQDGERYPTVCFVRR